MGYAFPSPFEAKARSEGERKDRRELREDLVRRQGEWAEWEVAAARAAVDDKFIRTQIFADSRRKTYLNN